MNGKFYLLWPLRKKLIFQLVTHVNARVFTESDIYDSGYVTNKIEKQWIFLNAPSGVMRSVIGWTKKTFPDPTGYP